MFAIKISLLKKLGFNNPQNVNDPLGKTRWLNCPTSWSFFFCVGLCHFTNHKKGESAIKFLPAIVSALNFLSNKGQFTDEDHTDLTSWNARCMKSQRNMNLLALS